MVFSKSQTKHEASNRSQCMHPKQNERAIRKTKALLSKRKPSNRFVMHPPGESGCIFSMHFFSRNPSRGWRRRKRARIIHIFGCICRFTLEICKNIKKRTETLYQSFSPLMLSWGYFLMRGIQVLISIVIPAYFVYNTIRECFEDIYIFGRLICVKGEIRSARCAVPAVNI